MSKRRAPVSSGSESEGEEGYDSSAKSPRSTKPKSLKDGSVVAKKETGVSAAQQKLAELAQALSGKGASGSVDLESAESAASGDMSLKKLKQRVDDLQNLANQMKSSLQQLQHVVVQFMNPTEASSGAGVVVTDLSGFVGHAPKKTARWNNLASCLESVNEVLSQPGDRSQAFKSAFGQNCTANLNVALDQLTYFREFGDLVPPGGKSLTQSALEKSGGSDRSAEVLLFQVQLMDIIRHARALGCEGISDLSKTFLEQFMMFKYQGRGLPEIREQRKVWRDALDKDRKKQERFPLHKKDAFHFPWAL